MRLLLLNYEFPPMGGGASNATFNIALELVKLGHSVDVLTSRFGDQPSEEIIQGIKVYRVTSWRHSIHNCGLRGAISYVFFAFFSLRGLLKKNRYDLLHYFFGLPTGLLSLYSHGIKNQPYILSLRGSDVPGYDTTSLKLRILHWLLKPITVRIWKKAERLVTVSHGLREMALQTLPGQPIRVIYNGIDTDLFKPAPHLNDTSNGHMRLLCVSRLIDRKGLDYLFQAVAEINDPRIRLDIVGTGGSEQRLKAKIRELGLETQVRFCGYKTALEVAEHYHQADIFILPSLSESQGMVLLEAMSCGLPIIASHVGGIPEVVADGENGILIPPAKVNAIIEAIHRLTNDSLLRSRISQNNPTKIKEQFTWIKIALNYQAIYNEALKREPS
ncbi:MAG: glycosyltransferase [Nitrospirae bacterium]|nr:glycosyltransferase [Nitrospirota bacterium]